MSEEDDKKLKYIIDYYSINHQLKHMMTEVFELIEAILNHNANLPLSTTQNISEEIADIMVFLRQIQLVYNITDKDIQDIMIAKIDRQIYRMDNDPNIINKYKEQ